MFFINCMHDAVGHGCEIRMFSVGCSMVGHLQEAVYGDRDKFIGLALNPAICDLDKFGSVTKNVD